eukprot:TRINITY_DN101669_c0_g1_i1.p1 TRINITY_DN101669_c0_g1~~TRINITY_DN101669_c0_g1_i1.p1  ORF type:complete len:1071 (-),score=245.34 TRINITY_DN101669_c0_g1_i1:172-3384(-)
MISSGELFILNGQTSGELRPLPEFVNQNIRVICANLNRAYVSTEPANASVRNRTVWCFSKDSKEAVECPEFETIDGSIRQIAIGEKHLLVLTMDGRVYSRGVAMYGSAGHGGAKDIPEFKPVPGLQNRNVRFVAAGPYFSIAVTQEADVFSWGQSFNCESGLVSKVDAVPRFAPAVTPFRVTQVSCGQAHVLACTEMQQCVAWGENTCGQLGVGQKSKPTYKPQVIDAIPSQVALVSAGWAHSLAVGVDGRAYSWGLNSHGQLGLGDTKVRLAPNLIHALVGKHHIRTAHASRALTLFHTAASKPLLCGQVPCTVFSEEAAKDMAPPPPGTKDPPGCLLCPGPVYLSGCMSGPSAPLGESQSELTTLCVFDHGAIGFARSSVYKVSPNLAPNTGGTPIQVHVTGLPFERQTRMHRETGIPVIQDTVPVKVRLRSHSPLCDVVVSGKIIEESIIEFITPNVVLSPLGSVVETGQTSAVQLQVSIDDGLTWTVERESAPPPSDSDKTILGTNMDPLGKSGAATNGALDTSTILQNSLKDFQGDFSRSRRVADAVNAANTVLWYCRWPKNGPKFLEPACAPVCGGTELTINVDLPHMMPTEWIIVKFVCKPLNSLGDTDMDSEAPLRKDTSMCPRWPLDDTDKKLQELHQALMEQVVECEAEGRYDDAAHVRARIAGLKLEEVKQGAQDIAALPLAGDLELLACGWLDPLGRGIKCMTPHFSWAPHCYEYFVELSLDGKKYLGNPLKLSVYELRVVGLEPSCGPLAEGTQVTIKTTGLVRSEIQFVRLDFPAELGYPSRQLPATYDPTIGEITFSMPDLAAEVRENMERGKEMTKAAAADSTGDDTPDGEQGTEASPTDAEAEALAVDTSGGLAGLQVFVELSLNGQNFTEDRVAFTYHGDISVEALELVALPEGAAAEPPPADAGKDKKGKGKAAEEPAAASKAWAAGYKVGCPITGTIQGGSKAACIRTQLLIKVGDEEPKPWRVEDMPGTCEEILPVSASGSPVPGEEPPKPREMLTVVLPGIRTEDLPEPSAQILMSKFQASLNGQHFVDLPEMPPVSLPALPPEPVPE